MHCIDIALVKCTGCGLCKNVCPYNAITMELDEEGFLSPVVNSSKCISCGICKKVCDEYMLQEKYKNVPIQVKACQTKDNVWAVESTAGGFFPTLAQYIIENGGIVYGTAFNEKMEAIVCKATTIDEIRRFNGSKYVQSNLSNAYQDIKNDLENGKTILFSGTPCQNAAIRTFLSKTNTDKFITLDVICYGVPSPGLFNAYISTVEKRRKTRVIDFHFRDKHKNGWGHTTVITMQDSHGRKIKYEEKDYRKIPYYRMFGRRNCFRKSCYSCKYTTINRITDFTTGNFWNISKMTDDFNTYLGVSIVLINTKKGQHYYKEITDRLFDKEMSIQQAIASNGALVHTCDYPHERDSIYKCFHEKGFSKMYRKYYAVRYFKILKRMVKQAAVKTDDQRYLNRNK